MTSVEPYGREFGPPEPHEVIDGEPAEEEAIILKGERLAASLEFLAFRDTILDDPETKITSDTKYKKEGTIDHAVRPGIVLHATLEHVNSPGKGLEHVDYTTLAFTNKDEGEFTDVRVRDSRLYEWCVLDDPFASYVMEIFREHVEAKFPPPSL